MNRLYETMYIIRPDLAEPDLEAVINKYQSLLRENQQEGDYIIVQNRGKRRGSSRVDLQACKLGTGRRFTTS
jgi:SSU ribosomal protein S6P